MRSVIECLHRCPNAKTSASYTMDPDILVFLRGAGPATNSSRGHSGTSASLPVPIGPRVLAYQLFPRYILPRMPNFRSAMAWTTIAPDRLVALWILCHVGGGLDQNFPFTGDCDAWFFKNIHAFPSSLPTECRVRGQWSGAAITRHQDLYLQAICAGL